MCAMFPWYPSFNMFKSWLPDKDIKLQNSTLVRSIRAAVCDSCRCRPGDPRDGCVQCLPPRIPERILSYLCVFHACDEVCGTNGVCDSIHWGHHPDQPTEEEFCAYIALEVLTNLDLAAEARGRPSEKDKTTQAAVVDDEDVGVVRDVANEKDDVTFEAVGGEGDAVDFEDDLDADGNIVYGAKYGLEAKVAKDIAMRTKENAKILQLAKTKKASDDVKSLARYIMQAGKLLTESYPLSDDQLRTGAHLGEETTRTGPPFTCLV